MAKYSLDIARQMFDERGYDLVSGKYESVTKKLNYICRRHPEKGVQQMTLKDLMKGSKCVYCKFEDGDPHNKPWPDDIIIQELDKQDCDYIGRYIKNKHTIVKFVCRKHPWKGVQETDWPNIKSRRVICGICNGTNRTGDDFRKIMSDINPNIEIIGDYVKAKDYVKCKCKIDGCEWEAQPQNLLSGFGCPECGYKRSGDMHRIDEETKMQKLLKMHPDIEFLSRPTLSHEKVHCRCKLCGHEWYATYMNMTKTIRPTGCPNCTTSTGEKRISLILNEWGINFQTQYKFDDLVDERKLPFDFYLTDYNILIEFDGEHHYKPIPRDDSEESAYEQFEVTVKHDNMKSDYCFNNNIPLIRIPYWYRDDLEYYLFDQLVKWNVIQEI